MMYLKTLNALVENQQLPKEYNFEKEAFNDREGKDPN